MPPAQPDPHFQPQLAAAQRELGRCCFNYSPRRFHLSLGMKPSAINLSR